MAALHMVHAGRWLPRDEQEALGRLVGALNGSAEVERAPVVG
ncbi:hypothetical protein [Streptomyces ficellus]|nr:hypothetical protein [Streptomyces ficellus]